MILIVGVDNDFDSYTDIGNDVNIDSDIHIHTDRDYQIDYTNDTHCFGYWY